MNNGFLGWLFGGATGVGGGSALDNALDALKQDYVDGIRVVDISGFSRGAALAPEFMRRVIEWQEAERKEGKTVEPIEFRFVGVYDMVASTGLANNDINLGLRFDLPRGEYAPKHMVHLIAGSENRDLFKLSDVGNVRDDNIVKKLYNDAHSDVGGGYRHKELSNITLHYMLEQMQRAGVPIDSFEEQIAAGHRDNDKFRASWFLSQDPYMIPHREQSILYDQIDRNLPIDITRDVALGPDWTPPRFVEVPVEPRRSPKGGIAERNPHMNLTRREFADPRESKDEDDHYQRYALDELP